VPNIGVNTWQLLLVLVIAATLAAAGIRYVRPVVAVAGFAAAGFVAFGHLTGRFGPELLWFRAPTFYVASALVLAGFVWWLRRPIASKLRIGALAAVLGLGGALLAFMLFNGRGAPATMLMPTLSATAPDLTFEDSAGRARKLSDFKGDVVLINFWATWCAPCRKEMPMLAKMQRDHGPQRFQVLYLSLEEPDVLQQFLAKNHFDGTQGRLIEVPEFYGAGKYYPLSYLLSRDGRVVKRWSGRPKEGWLDEAIRKEL
jgi:thiol-disulfide isomerase/thioredoxin